MNRLIFTAILVFCSAGLFASAPLEGGYSQIPVSASSEEKTQAFLDARRKVINAAVKYVDTPYVYGGISSKGLDCSGFVYVSFKDALGISLPRTTTGLYSWVEKIPSDKAQPGDILFFRTDNTGNISHVALYLGDGRFIHAASAGSQTGVKYSSLGESYYSRTFAGAGRAFPEANVDYSVLAGIVPQEAGSTGGSLPVSGNGTQSSASARHGRILVGAAFAPTWNSFFNGGDLLRGFTSQIHLGAETYTFGSQMIFGLEVRPEYDGALGVFRLPVTFSLGSDKLRFFAGPVLSFGEPSITTDGGKRHYSGGSSWLGAIGVAASPFSHATAVGEFSPYLEAAWQSYYSNNTSMNIIADFSAGFRFSTGLRWTMQIR